MNHVQRIGILLLHRLGNYQEKFRVVIGQYYA